MDDNFSQETNIIINNEYDYSNILPTVEGISYLVQFCDKMNSQLKKLCEEDEEKNKQYKLEFKNYSYKKTISQKLEIDIVEKEYQHIYCEDYPQFVSAVQGGNLNKVSSLKIRLELNFSRGKGDNLERHENNFTISFSPYEIKFTRKSNFNNPSMDRIEEKIKDILKQFPIANCIFCNKESSF